MDSQTIGAPNQKKKKSNRPLMISLAVLLFISGMWISTQYFAHIFHYNRQLGGNISGIYPPWAILIWSKKWYQQYTLYFDQSFNMGTMFAGVGFLIMVAYQLILTNSSKASASLHGSARWATAKDIIEAGLLSGTAKNPQEKKDGVFVGMWEDKTGKQYYLRHSGPEHVLTYAPTRSGKGVGLVVPTLLTWADSTVVTDLKGELWAMTSGWRKEYAGNKVLKFEPAALDSVKWNPLDEIRLETEYEIGDVQNIATLIVDPDGKGLQDHWQKTARSLFVGVILHSLYKAKHEGKKATLASVDAVLANPDKSTTETWEEMLEYKHYQTTQKTHPVVAAAARDMLDRPEEEGGSVLSSAKSYLDLWRDPIVANNTSSSDFSIKDLMNIDDPVSLYIVTQPNDKARLRPLIRIMITVIIRLLADKMDFENGRPKAHYKHKLLLMLDEFPSLGKLEILQESLAFVAGYGIKCYLICQDLNQLKSRETGYGQDETITSNCHLQNAYPPNRIETAEHLSRLTGTTTIVKEQITTSGKRAGIFHGQVSRTTQEVQRPLLTPDECLRMRGPTKNEKGEIEKAGDMVVYVAGYAAIYGCQPLYFKDETLLARASVKAPLKSDQIRSDVFEATTNTNRVSL